MKENEDYINYGMWLAEHADPLTPITYGTIGSSLKREFMTEYSRFYLAGMAIPSRRNTPRSKGHRRGKEL
jgi:hypothetical protein